MQVVTNCVYVDVFANTRHEAVQKIEEVAREYFECGEDRCLEVSIVRAEAEWYESPTYQGLEQILTGFRVDGKAELLAQCRN